MKNKKEVEILVNNILPKIRKMIGAYPSIGSDLSNVKYSYAIIKELNKHEKNDLFNIINTGKDEQGNKMYITRNKNKTIFFDHTTKNQLPWILIKNKDLSFSYKPSNFDRMHNIYNAKETEIEKLLIETEEEIDLTLKYYTAIRILNNPYLNDEVGTNVCNFLMSYLNIESLLSLTLSLRKENAEELLEMVLLEYKISNYNERITQLFMSKIKPILEIEDKKEDKKRKQKYKNIIVAEHKDAYPRVKIADFYESELKNREEFFSKRIKKVNLYLNLSQELVQTESKHKKNKI